MATNCAKDAEGRFRECLEEAGEDIKTCAEEADEGYDDCVDWREDRRSECCDWAPCSWLCDVIVIFISWVCAGYHWVENWVCVAWTVIKKGTCLVFGAVIVGACWLADAIVGAAGVLFGALGFAFGWALDLLGVFVEFVFSLPIIGRWAEWLVKGAHTAWNFAISIPDMVFTTIGIMPEKKLRLGVIILLNKDRQPTASDDAVLRAVQYMINVYRSELNVRVIPARDTNGWTWPFSRDQLPTADFLYHDHTIASIDLLDVRSDHEGLLDNLGPVGSAFNLKMADLVLTSAGRRLIGYGAPIIAFAVERVHVGSDEKDGFSPGPLADWVAIEFRNNSADTSAAPNPTDLTAEKYLRSVSDLAHECGHACSLPHWPNDSYLMYGDKPRQGGFLVWQKAIARSSRHVTFF
jgi:hypothetical protein